MMTSAMEWITFRRVPIIVIALTFAAAAALGVFNAFALTVGLPVLGSKSSIFALLLVPALIVVLFILARSDIGYGLVVLGGTAVISRTGLQLDIGSFRTSALEILTIVATVLLISRQRLFKEPPLWPRLVLDRPMLVFAVLSFPALLVALDREVLGTNIIYELKGYFLYPCLAYIMVAWIRTPARWRAVAALGIACSAAVALLAIWGWARGAATQQVALDTASFSRVGGSFGVINQYGFYLSTLALFALGFVLSAKRWWEWAVMAPVVGILFFGVALAGSRGPWIGLVTGLVALAYLRPRQARSAWPIILLGAVLFAWELPSIVARVTIETSSDATRFAYLLNGWQVFTHFPIFGAGWGAGFWLTYDGQLVPIDVVPWLHNDYLNLITQVGLVGMVPFLALWYRVLAYGIRQIRGLGSDDHKNLAAAALAALVAILVEAATDHVFWRPDIAGQVWWIVGLLLAAISLDWSSSVHARPSRT